MAAATNEWGKTRLWPGSTRRRELDATAYPFFHHAIAAGLVAPFSPFFLAILEHYQIQLLHLHPNSITILAVFAFTCEAFLGIKPSVALFRHFYSLRITAGNQCSGCVSFRAEKTGKKEDDWKFIPMNWSKKVEDFRMRWVYMDTRAAQRAVRDPDGAGGEELRLGEPEDPEQGDLRRRGQDQVLLRPRPDGADGGQGVHLAARRASPSPQPPHVGPLQGGQGEAQQRTPLRRTPSRA